MNCSAPLSIHFAKQDVKNEFFEKGWAEGGTKRCICGFYPPLPKKNRQTFNCSPRFYL